MRRGTAVTLGALSLALATFQSACDKPADRPATPAEMTPAQKAAADSADMIRRMNAPMLNDHDLSSFTRLPPPPAELQEDTIPIRTPEGGPARYGIRSGMLLQKFRGGMTGSRRMTWGAYGMNEQRRESYHPVKPIPGLDPSIQNVNRFAIATPEYMYIMDTATRTAYRENNKEDDTYLLNDSLKQMTFEAFLNTRLRAPEPRLADTTINGYRLHVYQTNSPQFSLTRWVWRGVTMLEHWRGLAGMPGGPTPPDTMEFYAEPAEITFNVEAPAETFAPPAGFKVVEGSPPAPKMSTPPAPRQQGAPPSGPTPPGGRPAPGIPAPNQPPVAPNQSPVTPGQTPPITPGQTPPGQTPPGAPPTPRR